MTRAIILLAALVIPALALPAPVMAAPGIDLAANNICPGVAGASGGCGNVPDCAARAAAGQFVSLFGTFICAEAVTDLSANDGEVDLGVVGDLTDDSATGASFWTNAPGGCVDANGGSIKFLGSKPTWTGSSCGTALAIREVFADGGSVTPLYPDNQHVNFFYNVFKSGSTSVTTANRVFGMEIRYDPAYAVEAGGPCGSCQIPVCFTWVYCKPGSLNGNPTTTLTTPTGTAGVNNEAVFNSCECGGLPAKPRTWGQLKSLYRQ